MAFPSVLPICSKGAVFNSDGRGFKALSAHYDKEAHALVLTLEEIDHVEGYLEPDHPWLRELGRAYAVGLIKHPDPSIWWTQIEMHLDLIPPKIFFDL